MIKLCLVLISITLIVFVGADEKAGKTKGELKSIEWNKGNGAIWSLNCDFNGGDMGREQSTGEQCGGKCSATNGCTHFSHKDGWCYKKSGPVTQNDAVTKNGVMCGILNSNGIFLLIT